MRELVMQDKKKTLFNIYVCTQTWDFLFELDPG